MTPHSDPIELSFGESIVHRGASRRGPCCSAFVSGSRQRAITAGMGSAREAVASSDPGPKQHRARSSPARLTFRLATSHGTLVPQHATREPLETDRPPNMLLPSTNGLDQLRRNIRHKDKILPASGTVCGTP